MPLPVTCPACGKSFSISDEVFEQKIKGRVVTVKCKQCQSPIRVDGTKGLAAAKVGPVPAPAAAAPEPAAPAPVAAAPEAEPAPAPPAPTAPAAPAAVPTAAEAASEAAAPIAAPAATPAPAPVTPATAATPAPAAVAPPAASKLAAASPAAATPSPAAAAIKVAAEPAAPAATPQPPAAAPTGAKAAGTSPLARAAAPRAGAPRATPAAAPSETRATAPTAGAAPAPAASEPSASKSAADSNLFAVDLPGGDREFTETQIADQLSKGSIGPDTLVWREGMSEWLEIRKVPDLARHMKKPAAAKLGETPSVPKAAATPVKGSAPTAAPAGRFRPRQPTLPMGMLPDAIQAALPQVQPVEPPAAAPPAPPAPAAPSAAQPPSRLPVPTPSPSRAGPDGPAGFAARERAAALLKPGGAAAPERKETPRVGTVRAQQLPVVPMPEQMLDEEPTILRPSPFGELDATPPPRAPLPTPVRELLARGQGEQPSAPRAAPERKFPSPPPSSPHPPSPTEPPAPRIDTFRATPEAKRSWFPESESEPPPPAPAAAPAPSSPFPVGAPRAVPPSSPLAAPGPSAAMPAPAVSSAFASAITSGPFASPVAGGPFAMPSAPMAPTGQVGFDEVQALRGQKKKTLLIVVAVLVVFVIGGVVAMLSGGSDKPPPAPAPEPHAATPSPAPTSEGTPSTGSPSTGAEATPGESGKAPPGGGDLPGAPGAAPNTPGGFAEMFAQGAKQAGSPGAASGHFDAGVAKNALDALLTEAARCREPGGPQGIARVAVTFAANGGVASATIAEPPFAGTSVGNCMCEAMKRARIKPFNGPPGTLTERISIR